MPFEIKIPKIRKEREGKFLAAIKKYGLIQLSEEGRRYFFEDD